MTRTATDIQAEIIAAKAGIAAAQARLADLEIELNDLEIELADLENDLENDHLNAMSEAAFDLLATAETVAPSTKYGPTARRAADKAVITRKFNAALKVWGGDYANLRAYVFKFGGDYPTAMRYLMANHLAR